MKYESYLAFDKEKPQKSFKETLHTFLDNDNSIHYSDKIHKEEWTNLESSEEAAGVGIGVSVGGGIGLVVGEIVTLGTAGPLGIPIGWGIGGAVGGGIGKIVKSIRYDTKWGHYNRENVCGWCWECTHKLLTQKNTFIVNEWICPEDCNLVLLLELIENFEKEDIRNQKQKTYPLKKNTVYNFHFNNFNSVRIEEIRNINVTTSRNSLRSSQTSNFTNLREENIAFRERISQLEERLTRQEEQMAQILQNTNKF